ncbi:MAG TPA: hypothetical protein VIM57_01690 [Luteolibacter sp.]
MEPSLPSPDRLFAQFERGEIERDELQAMMAIHARSLIAEMEEERLNPAAAVLNALHNRHAAAKWTRRHGQRLVRETLAALAELDDFPPSAHLWNALHPDVPLHCFFRTKRDPVFRVLKFDNDGHVITLHIEHGRGSLVAEAIELMRDSQHRLGVRRRRRKD